MFSLDIFEKILKMNIGVSQAANAEAFRMMDSIHPLKIKKYPSGREHNGWVIPHDWLVRKALIKKDGKILFDGKIHPMAVAGSSTSFTGAVSKEELDKHVFFKPEFPDAYVFHCMFNYRPWQKHWGFCVPCNIFREWGAGNYQIELETEFVKGDMLVGELNHKGELPETIVFNAHTCHPCQANDDMVGVMVILELFKWLATQKTRYSYRGVLAPEHLGTVFYLADLPEEELANFKLGCFVEMVGTDTPLALQKSFTGDTIIDRVAEHVLEHVDPQLTVGAFRTIVGNDETVWEAPGIEVPMISISRWPYKQYHTSEDNLKIISIEKLAQTLEALKSMIKILESDRSIQRRFKGLVSLSNPKYDLYVERPDPVVSKGLTEMDMRLGKIQDSLPRYFDGNHTVFEIADQYDVPFESLRDYLDRFQAKRLVDLTAPPSLDNYARRNGNGAHD